MCKETKCKCEEKRSLYEIYLILNKIKDSISLRTTTHIYIQDESLNIRVDALNPVNKKWMFINHVIHVERFSSNTVVEEQEIDTFIRRANDSFKALMAKED